MAMKNVVITGGGKAGRPIVRDLLEHGYRVLNADLVAAGALAASNAPTARKLILREEAEQQG